MSAITPEALLWAAIGFASGSLMLAYWVGWLFTRQDARTVGDGNPGATNVLKVGGWRVGGLALLLDIVKGAIPVAIARYLVGVSGAGLVLVALAPVFGHAFSPFMRFRGGKAVAVTGGVWIALTLWEIPTFGGITLGIAFALIAVSGWAVAYLLAILLVYLLIVHPADPVLLTIFVINAALLLWKYRADLRQMPRPRAWLRRRLRMPE
jgi:glycerol-3-phosphate acyltransferase PlsY